MDIVEELRRDRENGAKRLVEEYKTGLMTLARRFCRNPSDAEELVNRTFAAVVEGIDGFLEQSSFFTWMCQILVNLNANDNRRKANGDIVYPGELPEVADESADDGVYRALDAALLRDAIRTLPEDIRKTVVLHYFMEMSVKDIARFLAIPTGTVMWRLHYARKMLAVKMGAAAKKPGGKAVILALLLCGLTALGAAVWHLAVPGEVQNPADAGMSLVASRMSSSAQTSSSNLPQSPSGVAGSPQRQAEASNLSTFQPFNFSTDNSPGETMNITTTKRTAAMLAAATVATGATLSTPASTVTISVPAVADYTLAEAFANGCVSGASDVAALCAADDLQIDGAGRLIIDQDLKTAGFAGDIHVTAGATLRLAVTGALGDTAHGTFVAGGATLETLASGGTSLDFYGEPVSFAGTGVDGTGALKALSTTVQRNGAWGGSVLTMTGDATISQATHQNQLFPIGDSASTLNMNGFDLTIVGLHPNDNLTFRPTISNPGNIVATNVHLVVRHQAVFPGGAAHTLTISANARLQLFSCSEATRGNRTWTISIPQGGLSDALNVASAAAWWNGPIEFGCTSSVPVPFNLTLASPVTATAPVAFCGPSGLPTTVTLPSSGNVFQGGITLQDAVLKLDSGENDGRFYAGLNYGTRTDISPWTQAYYETSGNYPVTNKDVLNFNDLQDSTVAPSTGMSTFYSGYIWNPSNTPVTWRFASYSSRRAGLKFFYYTEQTGTPDSRDYAVQQDKDNIKFGNFTLQPGANKIEYRLSTSATMTRLFSTSPSDSPTWPNTLQVAYCTTSTTSTDPADFQPLADPGDGSVLRIAVEGTDYWNELAAANDKSQTWGGLAADDGETVDVGQSDVTVGSLDGAPAITSRFSIAPAETFTITGTWTLDADVVADGARLESVPALVFAPGATLAVPGYKALANGYEYTIAHSAKGIDGVPAFDSKTAQYCSVRISADGKSLLLKSVLPATVISLR